jgi:hypothetical protein
MADWSRHFDEPIPRPRAGLARGCRQIHHEATEGGARGAEWQAAMQALILVATKGGPAMLARIGIMQALNRHIERVFDPPRKDHHWGKRKLKRDEQ